MAILLAFPQVCGGGGVFRKTCSTLMCTVIQEFRQKVCFSVYILVIYFSFFKCQVQAFSSSRKSTTFLSLIVLFLITTTIANAK